MEITPNICVKDIKAQEGDLLILPGADTWLNEDNNEILKMICPDYKIMNLSRKHSMMFT